MSADAQRVMERCSALASVTDVAGETTRTFLSPAMARANAVVGEWMQAAGMSIRMDAAGNLRGHRGEAAKTLVMASHLDTVPNAGAYDGILGVVMAIEVAEAMRETALPFSIEVIGFSEEEGVRFGVPFIGSRALVGTCDDVLLATKDADGVTVREAIAAYGLSCDALPEAMLQDAFAYLEFHIEQGPVLEAEGCALGVVEAIAGQSRYVLTFTGKANHAGTTPMKLRQDAMSAAAEWIVAAEALAQEKGGLVATVGSVSTIPGAGNVIAGEVRVTLDVRSAKDKVRREAVSALLAKAEACGLGRGVRVETKLRMDQTAVAMDASLTATLTKAVGDDARRMISGAGHDAMIVAPHIPSAMLFLRSPGGLSHHPDESVLMDDVQAGLDAGVRFVELLAVKENNA
ncbi:allantoate amidohydrolase [Terriglobus saanensis]|uniref:Amidase, hydantoinase/carbamoylase family n=1 Tax=Terriglobus saanensis (strain ATCC BAA-1853 / DSM 23119 / SP1PR4) TaxID=401053 RepID=E8UY00_TERSS|nr:allantoate amidohydrolase [Terriglobus saanensis]ADV84234.1 amidase, hydantoinase/carbamoylase family [Terriglobus saanensis SP1PR4]